MEKLKRQLQDAHHEKSALAKKVDIYLEENKSLKNQLKSYTASESQTMSLLSDVRKKHELLLKMQTEEHEEEIENLNLMCKQWQQRANNSDQSLKIAEENNKQQTADSNNLQSQIKQLEKKHERELAVSKREMKHDVTKQVNTLQELISRLQKENQEKDERIKQNSDQFKHDSDMSSSKFRVRTHILEDQLKTTRSELELKSNELEKLTTKLSSIENKQSVSLSKHKTQEKDFKEKITSLEREIKNKNDELQSYTSQRSILESENNHNLAKYRAEVLSLEDQVEILRKENSEKDGKLCLLSNQLAGSEKKNNLGSSKYKLQLNEVEEEMKFYKREVKLKEQEIERLNKQTKDLKQDLNISTSSQSKQVKSLEDRIKMLRQENYDKEEQLTEVTTKLNMLENESSSADLKIKHQNKISDDRIKRLEKQIKVKDEELCRINGELDSHELNVKSQSSQQRTELGTFQEKVRKLEAENQNKEEQLYKVSTKLAHTELEIDSVSSNYRIKVRTLEEKIERLQNENKQKEEQLINSEVGSLEVKSEVQTLKDQIRRMEIESKRNKTELVKLRSAENELNTESTENSTHLMSVERDRKKLEVLSNRLKNEISELTRKLSSAECDLAEAKCNLIKKERFHEKSKKSENELKTMLEEKEDLYQSEITKIKTRNEKNQLNLQSEIEHLSEKCNQLESESLTNRSIEPKVKQLQADRGNLISELNTLKEKCHDYESMKRDLKNLKSECSELQSEKQILMDRFDEMENECSVIQSMQTQIKEYDVKFSEMKSTNARISKEKDRLGKDLRDLNQKFKENKDLNEVQASKIFGLEKTIEMLKECCMTLENQAEELEDLNNNLIEKQNIISIDRDEALKNVSQLEFELKSLQHQLKAELSELDQTSNDQITEMKIQLRTEMNEAHELEEQHRDLERRYKMLELNAASVQRKLNLEKESHQRTDSDYSRIKTEVVVLQQSLSHAEENLQGEMDRCDAIEQEKTKLLNQMETEKLEKSHELIKLNCTGAQQLKLIDFLQARVEDLEPHDKKKNKKKVKIYQAPLQYRELCDLLDEEKSANVRLQQQVNMFRTELQQTNTKVKRLKHKMGSDPTPLSPGSIAAISAIVKSPAVSTPNTLSPSKQAKLRSKHRMHHNIPHRLSSWLCNRGTRCSVCLAVIHFGHSALKCSECAVVCHTKCQHSVTNTCGLPGGLFEKFKDGTKSSNLSPISCVLRGGNSDVIHGYLKVLCGDDIWVPRMVRITANHVRISPKNAKSPTKSSVKDDMIDLTQAAYIHTDIRQLEIPSTAKHDVPYVFKIQTGSGNSCWPARSVYFLAAGFAEKHKWVEQLENIASKHNEAKNVTSNPKIFGNEILALLGDEKLEINCSVPVSDKKILFGCDEGLFQLSPSTKNISTRANITKVNGVSDIYQMETLDKSHVVAIEGSKHRLITFDISKLETNKVNVQVIDNMEGCHLFAQGRAEGLCYIAAASATSLTIFKYNNKLNKFIKQKEIGTSEPCTCMVFTACSVIFGTNNFYEVDLTDYKVDEFLNIEKSILKREIKDGNIFPVSVLKINDTNGKQEFLLCFHEFGLFVDGFGRQTRGGQITWSRMPLSFEYRDPYLVVIQFNSVEIIKLDSRKTQSAELSATDHSFLSFPSARYLGPAITEGAIYLSSCELGKMSVFCCKGNMNLTKLSGNKRHYAKLSGSMDSLASPVVKRSAAFADVSNLKNSRGLSASCDSLSSDTSHWTTTTGGTFFDDQSSETVTLASEYMGGESSQESVISEESRSSAGSVISSRLRWNHLSNDNQVNTPVKPLRKTRVNFRGKEDFEPLSTTQV